MENYICVNGKKAALTPEQLKTLDIELKEKSPFKRKTGQVYHYINYKGMVETSRDHHYSIDEDFHNVANYCTDKSLMEQRALHETLNRLLWRYSMEHDGDKIDWNDRLSNKFRLVYHNDINTFEVDNNQFLHSVGCIYFHTRETAQNAIKDIIEPFMKEHPEFKW